MPVNIFRDDDNKVVGYSNCSPESKLSTQKHNDINYAYLFTDKSEINRARVAVLIGLLAVGTILSLGLIWVAVGFIPGGLVYIKELPTILMQGKLKENIFFHTENIDSKIILIDNDGSVNENNNFNNENDDFDITNNIDIGNFNNNENPNNKDFLNSSNLINNDNDNIKFDDNTINIINKENNHIDYLSMPKKVVNASNGSIMGKMPFEGFTPFGLNCQNNDVTPSGGVDICRYRAGEDPAYAYPLAQIMLTSKMALDLPYLPDDIKKLIKDKPIGHADVIVWGNIPKVNPNDGAGGEYLMLDPRTLLVSKKLNNQVLSEEGTVPTKIGIFTDKKEEEISSNREGQFEGLETGVPVNNGLAICNYDLHNGNYASVMGTFNVKDKPVCAFTSVIIPAGNESGNQVSISFHIILSDKETKATGKYISEARNLDELLIALKFKPLTEFEPLFNKIEGLRKVFS